MKYLDVCSEIIFHVLIWKSCASQSFLLLRLLKKVAISLGKIYAKKPGIQAQQYLNYKYYKTYVTRRLLLSFQGSRTMNPTGHRWEQSKTSLHFIGFILLLWYEVKTQAIQNAQQGNSCTPVPSLRDHLHIICCKIRIRGSLLPLSFKFIFLLLCFSWYILNWCPLL